MKKAAIVAVCVLGFIFSGKAQEKGKIEFGGGTGLNYSNIRDSYGSSDGKVSFNVSASADYYFSDRWSVRAKLIYDRKGYDNAFYGIYEQDTGITNIKTTSVDLNYFTIPIETEWHFGRKRNWYMHLGPYAGFLINSKAKDLDIDTTEDFKNTDFGVAFGIGVKFPISDKLKLYVEYDEQMGFSEIFENSNNSSFFNTRLSLNVGVNFLLN